MRTSPILAVIYRVYFGGHQRPIGPRSLGQPHCIQRIRSDHSLIVMFSAPPAASCPPSESADGRHIGTAGSWPINDASEIRTGGRTLMKHSVLGAREEMEFFWKHARTAPISLVFPADDDSSAAPPRAAQPQTALEASMLTPHSGCHSVRGKRHGMTVKSTGLFRGSAAAYKTKMFAQSMSLSRNQGVASIRTRDINSHDE